MAQDNRTLTESLAQTVLISLVCSSLTLLGYVLLFQPLAMAEKQQQQIAMQNKTIEALREEIQISRQELTSQMQNYLNENYGDISERDEKIEKLLIYFKQQDARLSNIEEALAKF